MLLAGVLVVILLVVTILGLGAFFMPLQVYVRAHTRASTREPVVAITFDDGPVAGQTERVLEVLAKWEVRATFFLVGLRVAEAPELARRIVSEGHTLGLHSYEHLPRITYARSGRVASDLSRCQEEVYAATGLTARWFRPPFGVTNPRIGRAVRRLRLQVIGWSIRSLDTVRNLDSACRRVLRNLRPGAIILLHDSLHQSDILLERVLTGIRAQGYAVKPLAEILQIEAYENA